MSSKAEVTIIAKEFSGVPIDSFVIKAAQKAFKHVAKTDNLNVKRIHDHDNSATYFNVQDLRIGELVPSTNGVAPYDQALIKVHQVADSADSLPICEEPAILSLHYTVPEQEVVYKGEDISFDIASEELADIEPDVVVSQDEIRVAHTTRLSISYDVQKIDDLAAAEFMQRLKFLLDDPEMLLL